MPDPFDTAFAQIGADFEAYMAPLADVAVRQIDPQDGSTLATVADVPALKRVRSLAVAPPGIGTESCRFVMRRSRLSFMPSSRDQIEESGGTIWDVGDGPTDVQLIAAGQLVAVNVTLARTDAEQTG
jgi:hypothetical protein